LEILDFVLATRLSKPHIRISGWLANFPEWQYQLASRVVAFQTLLHRLHPNNLYTTTWTSFKTNVHRYLVIASGSITSSIAPHPAVLSYLNWCHTQDIPADARGQKRNYILWRTTLYLARDQDLALVSYLPPGQARLQVDRFLGLGDLHLRVAALSWRINRFPGIRGGVFPSCTSCSPPDDVFSRTHFNQCELFRESNIVSEAVWTKFHASLQHRSLPNFSIMDFVLNRGLFDVFHNALLFSQNHSDPPIRWL